MARFEIPAGRFSYVCEDGHRVFVDTLPHSVDTEWVWLRVRYAKGWMAARIARAVDVYLRDGGLDVDRLDMEVGNAVADYVEAVDRVRSGR